MKISRTKFLADPQDYANFRNPIFTSEQFGLSDTAFENIEIYIFSAISELVHLLGLMSVKLS